jgi:PAS domain S-box-containing protein
LLRELVLYLSDREPPDAALAADMALSDRARGIVSRVVARRAVDLRLDAMSSWEPVAADIEVGVPRDAGPAYVALRDCLDLGERLAANGELLTRPGLPEIIELRDWVCQQIAAQLAGIEPSAWVGAAHERFETAVNTLPGRATLPADVLGISGSSRSVVAVDVANRITAVSRPLAELVGWSVGDLVGRRIGTLIPPELREAHVAGFSRYLSSGETHIMGVPLELLVLRRDGSRLRCRLKVEEAPGAGGEAMFVGWIDPVPLVPVPDEGGVS